MDFVRLLQSLEEAVYEIVTWVIFVPRTFVKVIARPNWISGYITAELEKETADRFQAYISPIIFWLIVAVLPYTLISVNVNISGSILTIGDLNTSTLYLSAVTLVAIPALSSVALLLMKKLPLDRESLKRLFYIQCYPAAILELFFLPAMALVTLPKGSVGPEVHTLIQVSVWASGIWYMVALTTIFKHELSIHWLDAFGRAALTSALSTVVLVIIMIVITLYLTAIGVVQPPAP